MIVIKLAEQQKDILQGKEYTPDSFFNPIQDKNDNWIISIEEYNELLNSDYFKEYEWLLNCEKIEYEAKKIENIFNTDINLDISNQNLSADELNNFFTSLPTTTESKIITITGNQGAGTCAQLIATTKGYIVIN